MLNSGRDWTPWTCGLFGFLLLTFQELASHCSFPLVRARAHRVPRHPFSETPFFVFGAPLKWRLISSARDSEIFCLTSFVIPVTLQRKGTGARHCVFCEESRSDLCREIRLLSERCENLGRSREMNCVLKSFFMGLQGT